MTDKIIITKYSSRRLYNTQTSEYVTLDQIAEFIRDGKEVTVRMMAQAYINHKGYEVKVGSGWNQEQRLKYEANPELIIGKTITVQYFEESKNQQGELSLRFPTVKHVYENGRNV